MKNLLISLICLVLASNVSFGKDSVRVISFDDIKMAIDWSSINSEMAVYKLDEEFNYIPFQNYRGSEGLNGQILVFEHIYNNIDLVITPLGNQMVKYEFTVYPGGDINQIHLLEDAFVNKKDTGVLFMASGLKAYQDEAGSEEKKVKVMMTKSDDKLGLKVGEHEFAQSLSISFELKIK
ncbi:MAG: hypothetical protein MRZ79_18970 [Bacteroidia bacterium]|nr:hypothetical protein [Bacteroidia bacterium]